MRNLTVAHHDSDDYPKIKFYSTFDSQSRYNVKMAVFYYRIFYLISIFIIIRPTKCEICPNFSQLSPHLTPNCDDLLIRNPFIKFLVYHRRISEPNLKYINDLNTINFEIFCFELENSSILTYKLTENYDEEEILGRCEIQGRSYRTNDSSKTTKNAYEATLNCDANTNTDEEKFKLRILTAPEYQFMVLYLCKKDILEARFQLLFLVRVGLQYDQNTHLLLNEVLKAVEMNDFQRYLPKNFYNNIESLTKIEKRKLKKEFDFETMSQDSKMLFFGLIIFVIGIFMIGFCCVFCVSN